ncbi:MAG: hypothetical protein EA355_00245 [Rhodobacteraceae bacterium]|nr:MAG: hypothetical protein EA355_00245 [Paracoccaceae bacterium]
MPHRDDFEETAAGRSRLRGRIATLLCLAVMPAVILSVADGLRRYTRVVEERDAAFVAAAQQDARATRDALLEIRATLGATAASPAVKAFESPACDAHLRDIVVSSPIHRLAVAVDAAGAVRCASRPMPPETSFADDPALRRFFERPRFDVAVRAVGQVSGEEVLIASAPIEREGAVVGALTLSISAAALRYFEALQSAGGGSMRAIVDADGAVLLDVSANGADAWLPRDRAWPARFGAEPTVAIAESADGVRRVFGVSPFLADRAWLVAGAETGALYDEAILRVLPALVAPLLTLAIAVGVSWFALDRLVIRHLDYLARLARAYGRGRLDLKPRLDDTAPAEIASLFGSVGKMAAQLADRERDLRRSAETNRLLLLEVYHRVRNNLQLIASLLNLQMRRADADVERAALGRLRDRVHSLALVHEKLYESDAPDALDVASLIGDVARAAASGGVVGGPSPAALPALELDLGVGPMVVGPEVATPLALLVEETVRDAVRRSVGAGRDGRVRVTLERRQDGGILLAVENDEADEAQRPRAGAPADGCFAAGDEAAGARLVASLARQMRGEVTELREGRRRVVRIAAPATISGEVRG